MRILTSCDPDYVWYDFDRTNPKVTKWYGYGLWSILDILGFAQNSSLEIVPKSSGLLHAVANGQADVAPYEFGLTSQRYNIVDYTNTVHFTDVVILSKTKTGTIIKNFILEIFDVPTFICIGLSFIILSLLIWLHSYKSGLNISFVSTFIHSFGALFLQGFPAKSRIANQRFGLLFCLAFMLISTLFSGLVISKLMKREVAKNIETLDDVRQMSNLKIIIIKDSFIDDAFETNTAWHDLKSRLDYMKIRKPKSIREALDKINEETHVMIDARENFQKYMKAVRYDKNKQNKFHLSGAIDKGQGGWIMPKTLDKNLKEFINLNLQWLVDLGLYDVYKRSITSRLFRHIGM